MLDFGESCFAIEIESVRNRPCRSLGLSQGSYITQVSKDLTCKIVHLVKLH